MRRVYSLLAIDVEKLRFTVSLAAGAPSAATFLTQAASPDKTDILNCISICCSKRPPIPLDLPACPPLQPFPPSLPVINYTREGFRGFVGTCVGMGVVCERQLFAARRELWKIGIFYLQWIVLLCWRSLSECVPGYPLVPVPASIVRQGNAVTNVCWGRFQLSTSGRQFDCWETSRARTELPTAAVEISAEEGWHIQKTNKQTKKTGSVSSCLDGRAGFMPFIPVSTRHREISPPHKPCSYPALSAFDSATEKGRYTVYVCC